MRDPVQRITETICLAQFNQEWLHNVQYYYFVPSRRARCCHQSVCLFVCLLAYLRNHTTSPNFTNFSVHVTYVTYHVTCDRGSVLLWRYAIRYVRPVLWMTSCFHLMERMGLNQTRRVRFVQFARWQHRDEVCRFRLYLVRNASFESGEWHNAVEKGAWVKKC